MNTLAESPTILRQKSKTTRITFISTTVSGVAYYRLSNFAWKMRRHNGIQTHVWPYSHDMTLNNPWQVDMLDDQPRVFVKSLDSQLSIRQYLTWLCETSDVIVWQLLNFQHSLEFWEDLRLRYQKPFLTEVDDYCADVPATNEAFEQLRPGAMRYKVAVEQMRRSDGLIVSTPYLAEQYKDMNDRIYVVPNSLDLKEWDAARRRGSHDRIRIGWIGGGTHSADLEMVEPVIRRLTKRYENVWFYCIHGVPNCYKKMPQVYWTHKWSKINLYPRFLSSFKFDIGIAPLVDNNFNRGKSNLRWLEYSGLRIPTVASPLPDFKRVIKHGENGLLADSLDEWERQLEILILDAQKRRAIGEAAYKTVKKDFNVVKNAHRYMQLLKGISNGESISG